MQKRNTIIALIVIVIVVVGGYAILNSSTKKTPTSQNTSNSSNSSSTPSTSGTAVNNSVVLTKTNSSVGSYLVDVNGNTLYTYSADTPGKSSCTGACLSAWPAYQDSGATTDLPTNIGTIKRTDNGQIQYTYRDLPLYLFTADSKGQVTGNGVSGFVVAKP